MKIHNLIIFDSHVSAVEMYHNMLAIFLSLQKGIHC